MSRKPVDQASSLRGQEHIWNVIMDLGRTGPMTLTDIHDKTNARRDTVREYLCRLELGGFLKRIDKAIPVLYDLVRRAGSAPRLRRDGTQYPPTKRESMWRTMRMLNGFSARDLAISASTEEVPVREIDAKDYIKHLLKAEYLLVIQPSRGSIPAVYRLRKYTGPKPPQIQRIKQVFDPNLNAVVWSAGGAPSE